LELSPGSRVAVFTAHPDDETGCSGTLARLADRGHEVHLVVATDGDAGSPHAGYAVGELAAIRRVELEEAARILGIRAVHWLGFGDGTLAQQPDLRRRVYDAVRMVEAEVLFCMDPWAVDEPHPDHRTICMTAFEAAYLANGEDYFPEQIEAGRKAHHTAEVFFFHTARANRRVAIDATILERKIAALGCHKSQMPVGTPRWEERMEAWRERARRGEMVEDFHRVGWSELELGFEPGAIG
jgi:LmbE family N-acetylglucosaminyl deacetylase